MSDLSAAEAFNDLFRRMNSLNDPILWDSRRLIFCLANGMISISFKENLGRR